MRLSICYKSGVEACLLLNNEGGILDSHIDKYVVQDNPSQSQYIGMIHAFTIGLKKLKQYIEISGINEKVVIESNNTVFLTWVNRTYALPQYEKDFMEMLSILRDIPIPYEFIYNKDLIAKQYAKPTKVTQHSISKLEPLL